MQQAKRQKIQMLMKQLKRMDEEERELIAQEMQVKNPEGHILSPRNHCLLVFQAEDNPLSVVAGFKQWQKHNRIVSKGSKGYLIAVPSKTKSGSKNLDKNGDGEEGEENELFFLFKTVFDISQTEELVLEEV